MSPELRRALVKAIGDSYDGCADPQATPGNWRRAESALAEAEAVLHSEGYAVVPREPTPWMLRAGVLADDGCDMPGQVWSAMLQASPTTSKDSA